MSPHFSWQSAVLQSGCESTTKYVLLVVGTYMNQHGNGAFPSHSTIAESASLHRATVIKHLGLAEEAGWLCVTRRFNKDGEPESNLYGISFPDAEVITGNDGGVVVQNDYLVVQNDRGSRPKRLGVVVQNDTNTPVVTPQLTQLSPNPPRGVSGEQSEKKDRPKKVRVCLKTFLSACKANGLKPVTGYAPLMEYVRRVELPSDFIEIAWDTFVREHTPGGANEKRLQADWQRHFYNYVTKGYYRLWICKPDGRFELTPLGIQTRKYLGAA